MTGTPGGVGVPTTRKVTHRAMYTPEGIRLEVPDNFTREQALDAMEDFFRDTNAVEYSPLSGSEIVGAINQGIEAIQGKEFVFPEDEDPAMLKAFVLDAVAGHILTSENVDPTVISMVFMPIALGALEVPQAVMDEIADKLPPCPPTTEFTEPEPTPEPLPASTPIAPEAPATMKCDPQEVERLARGEFFGTLMPGETLEAYRASIRDKNAALKTAHKAALSDYEKSKQDYDREVQAVTERNAARHREWEDRKKRAEQGDLAAVAKYDVACVAARIRYWKDMGCIWQHCDKAHSGRGVNGYPIFWSFNLMSAKTWERALAAIRRECDRQKEIEV